MDLGRRHSPPTLRKIVGIARKKRTIVLMRSILKHLETPLTARGLGAALKTTRGSGPSMNDKNLLILVMMDSMRRSVKIVEASRVSNILPRTKLGKSVKPGRIKLVQVAHHHRATGEEVAIGAPLAGQGVKEILPVWIWGQATGIRMTIQGLPGLIAI
jgi:hypothetical protein